MKKNNLREVLDTEINDILRKNNADLENISIDVENPRIDVEEIAKKVGCSINYDVLFKKSGIHDSNENIITVNILDPEYRQRFTIAHEIAHHVLKHDGIMYRNNESSMGDINTVIRERAANNFAAKLLMPELLLKKVREDIILEIGNVTNQKLIVEMAKKFDVSFVAMEYRLNNIGLLN